MPPSHAKQKLELVQGQNLYYGCFTVEEKPSISFPQDIAKNPRYRRKRFVPPRGLRGFLPLLRPGWMSGAHRDRSVQSRPMVDEIFHLGILLTWRLGVRCSSPLVKSLVVPEALFAVVLEPGRRLLFALIKCCDSLICHVMKSMKARSGSSTM